MVDLGFTQSPKGPKDLIAFGLRLHGLWFFRALGETGI